jgi:lipopolysaccharide biosynthesis regulator YciM
MITKAAIDALYATGVWLLEEHRARDAMDIFRAMLLSAPNDERGWLGLGTAHEAVGEIEVAVQLYALCARAAHPGRCDVARARALRSLDRDDEAATALDDAERFIDHCDDDDVRALIMHERAAS